MDILITWKSWEGTAIHMGRWSNLVVTSSLKFKVVIYHTHNSDLSIHILIYVHRCTELWLWIYQLYSGVLVSGCTHTHVNCNLECIRLLFMCMLNTRQWLKVLLFLDRVQQTDVWCGYWSFSTLRWLICCGVWEARYTRACWLCCSLWVSKQVSGITQYIICTDCTS